MGRQWHRILDLIEEARLDGRKLVLAFRNDPELIGPDFGPIVDSLHLAIGPDVYPFISIKKAIDEAGRRVELDLPGKIRGNLIEIRYLTKTVIGRQIYIKKDGS